MPSIWISDQTKAEIDALKAEIGPLAPQSAHLTRLAICRGIEVLREDLLGASRTRRHPYPDVDLSDVERAVDEAARAVSGGANG